MNLKSFLETPIAHRGLHGGKTPENSLAAFRAALASGYGIECDVRVTRDGGVMVFHDRTLARMTGDVRPVKSVASTELSQMRLGDSDECVPRLCDVLSLVDAKVPLIVEVKTNAWNARGDMRRVNDTLKEYHGDVLISSFSARATRVASSYGYMTGYTFRRKTVFARLWSFASWCLYGCVGDVLAVPESYRGSLLLFAIKKMSDAPIILWTLHSDHPERTCAEYGCGIIFERGV